MSYDLCKAVAVALAARGVGTEEPTVFTEEEHKTVSHVHSSMRNLFLNSGIGIGRHLQEFLLAILSSSVECKASRARALGWEPRYGDEEFFGSFDAEVGAALRG